MANTNVSEKAARRKRSLLELAEELGNVSKACKIIDRFYSGATLKCMNADLDVAVNSRQQEEKDMALILSREPGVFVNSEPSRYKGNLNARLDPDLSPN